ncbi:MAG TPA: UDP-N-acetylmuramoyl-tripeptide--D-alanyl-D-alanine ligase [Solirubrobacterales bacterium]|nr:UDP-N-acetylmuramoyl-tripeptide--D-alanyl-D-alanine ligase [Solirubrobacterales bacterium]
MIELSPERVAAGLGGEVTVAGPGSGSRPGRAVIDSREAGPDDLFFGLAGTNADGGRFAAQAIEQGAWGAVVTAPWAAELKAAGVDAWVFAVEEPLTALQSLARAWRRELGCPAVGITGSTGKTSVKDIARAILPRRVHASPENFNTEIGLPLTLLSAPPETELLVLEMAMRGRGQIEELCAIAEPDVAAITNVGPVHLELLGSFEAVVEAKAEILHGLGPSGRAVIPADEEALSPHLRDSLEVVTFGPGGDVFAPDARVADGRTSARIGTPNGAADFELPFAEAHNLTNALCAVAIGVALDLDPAAMAARTARIEFSRLRGERIALPGPILLLNDCYNANPISMRAALENLAGTARDGDRAVAVLGGMAELGPEGPAFHSDIAALARERGIGPLIGVGELARDYGPDAWAADADAAIALVAAELRPGDVVLVKGSRSVGLERLTDGIVARLGGNLG